MTNLTDRQKTVLLGLTGAWKRPAQIEGYTNRHYGALRQLVNKGLVEYRLRGVGTGDSREYRVKTP